MVLEVGAWHVAVTRVEVCAGVIGCHDDAAASYALGDDVVMGPMDIEILAPSLRPPCKLGEVVAREEGGKSFVVVGDDLMCMSSV